MRLHETEITAVTVSPESLDHAVPHQAPAPRRSAHRLSS